MTSNPAEEAVERQLRIRVPAEVAYAYWVDPAKLMLWQGMEAELDPQPGGIYRVNVTGRDITRGEFVTVEPNQRLVFTWGFERAGHPIPAGSTRVEVDFVAQGDLTVIKVHHYGISKPEQLNTAYGWQHYLTRLGVVIAGRDPGPDPWISPPPPPAPVVTADVSPAAADESSEEPTA